jgi:hypothetical protein
VLLAIYKTKPWLKANGEPLKISSQLFAVDSGLRQEEWQFPAQILPLVSETIAQAGFSIVKVRDAL